LTAARRLFDAAPGDRDVRPLVERLPSVPATRPALPIAAPAPPPRPLFASNHGAVVEAAPPAPAPGPDHATVEREIAAARADAERAARAAVAAEAEATLNRYLTTLKALDRAIQQTSRPPVHDVVELAMVVAREIIGRELTTDRGRVTAAIDEALSAAGEDHEGAVVRVNPDDLAYVQANHGEKFPGVDLVPDPRLQAGGCVVETARAIVDASIEARMSAVRRAVQSALSGGEPV
jgi:flagellar assembly protein FliH